MEPLTLWPNEAEEREWQQAHNVPETTDDEFFMRRIAASVHSAVYDAPIIVNPEGYELIRTYISARMSYQQFREEQKVTLPPPGLLLGHICRVVWNAGNTKAPYFEVEHAPGA